MIEIDIYEKNHRYAIKATGHAEYAPYGKDIVCAAISTLLQTYAFYLNKEAIHKKYVTVLEIKLDPGDMNVEYLDLKDFFVNCFEMMIEGIEAVENTYPGFVKVNKNIWQ